MKTAPTTGRSFLSCVMVLWLTAVVAPTAHADTLEDAIQTLSQVTPGDASLPSAQQAIRVVEDASDDAIVPLLHAVGSADPVADNWLRSAFEVATSDGMGDAQREAVLTFYNDRSNRPRARRMAFEALTRDDGALRTKLLDAAIDDPSEEIRYDAVGRVLNRVTKADSDETKRQLLRDAWAAATVREQVDNIADQLEALGESVDVTAHYGFLTDWHAVGPFDNKDEASFDVALGPERADLSVPDLTASFKNASGPVKWDALSAEKADGFIDLAEQIGPHKGALIYATTTFQADKRQSAELRLSTSNAWKLWLNGQLIFEREEYHRGLHWDQYRLPVTLEKGANVIVLKVLQNEQEQSWAQRWSYSLRVTDLGGRAVADAGALQ